MKKILLLSVLAAFMLNVTMLQASEPKNKKAKQETVQTKKEAKKLSEAEIQQLTARVNEINQMDKKALTPKERRDLRKEVRGINDKINKSADGIYIGGGALLVVIILLLLLL